MRPVRLPNESVRYRKHKQVGLDGIVAGLERPHGHGTPAVADIGPWGPPPPEYIPGPPQSYSPHPGFAEFPEPEYQQYEPAPLTHNTPALRMDPPAPAHAAIPEPAYETLTEAMFAQAMGEAASPGGPEALEQEAKPTELHEPGEMPMPDPIQEIDAAMEMQAMPEPPQPDPYEMQGDPMQPMDPFGMPGPGM